MKPGRDGAQTVLETFARTTIEDNINFFKTNPEFVRLLEEFHEEPDDPGLVKSGTNVCCSRQCAHCQEQETCANVRSMAVFESGGTIVIILVYNLVTCVLYS